ncbi:MAG: two-component regulator propeller domain-containing protein, partial [Marinirhabdus sp.]
NRATAEIQALNTINGLSGEEISILHYSENHNLLIIGYENGLIEVVTDGEEDILSVVDILEKPTIPPDEKKINNFYEYNNNLYISTGFGISVFNLASLEFGDTYIIGPNGTRLSIEQVAVQEPYIYAAGRTVGIHRALVANNNLIDFNEWTVVEGGNIRGLELLGDELYSVRINKTVKRLNPVTDTFEVVGNIPQIPLDFEANNGLLTITTENTVAAYSAGFQLEQSLNSIPENVNMLTAGLGSANTLYVGTETNGLLEIQLGSTVGTAILPEGPLNNSPFALSVSPGNLWVAFGEVNVFYNPFPITERGISNLKENVWANLKFDEIFEANDLVNTLINPADTSQVYFTSYQKGLLRITAQQPEILFNETNSPLNIPGGDPDLGIRLYGMDFDRDGNLWFVQSRESEGLIKLTPSGQFEKIDLSSVFDSELALTEVKVNRQGDVFFGTSGSGLIGYRPSTGQFNRIEEGIGNGNFPSTNVRALAFDNNNRLWIGTLEGLRVLFNPGGFFEEGADTDAQPIIIEDNEGVGQELLFQQPITDIKVDGSNNKWISTATSGVFYVSPNGQETLLRFTKDNSPLPSNTVQDIAIDPLSGTVYFATINGLVAFKGTATAPRDDLEQVFAYPNPVRPGFSGNVTIDGLTAGANVKITDISGNLVFETTGQGGSVLWDTTAFGKYPVASGVYLVLITSEDALLTKITKI